MLSAATFKDSYVKWCLCCVISVADPGCLSRIPDPTFSIQDPNCLHPGSRILIKEFKYFNPKKGKKMVSEL
jgi:hypothetical protein